MFLTNQANLRNTIMVPTVQVHGTAQDTVLDTNYRPQNSLKEKQHPKRGLMDPYVTETYQPTYCTFAGSRKNKPKVKI
jgi:hypothetical protein